MRLLLFLIITLAVGSAAAQDFTQGQADSLRQVLAKTNNVHTRIKTLIHLAEYHIWKKGELAIDLDSANTCLTEAERLNRTVQSTALAGHHLLMKGFMLTEKGKRKEGQTAVEQSIPLLQKSNSQRLLGLAYFELQAYFDYSHAEQRKERIRITGLAVLAFHQAGDKLLEGWALTTLGDLYSIQEEYAESNGYLLQAVTVYNAIGHKKLQDVYELLGRNCNNQGDYKHAFEYALLALKAVKATNDSTMQVATINNLLGSLYRSASRVEIGIGYYQEGLAVALRHNDGANALLMVYILGRTYLDVNQPRKALDLLNALPKGLLDSSNAKVNALLGMIYMGAYHAEKQLKKAHKYSVILEKLTEGNTLAAEWANQVCIALVRYYLKEHDIAKARLYLNKCMAVSLLPTSPEWVSRYDISYRVDSAEGNYKAAFYDLLKYKTLNDSLHDDVKTRQFQQLDVEFETSKKADSISLLTQKTNLQSTNLRQAHLIRNITMVGIILALAVIGLLYRQYQLKQRNNKTMAVKNERLEHLVTEKEWLLQEVNHRVKNNLQTIVSLLELQSDSLTGDAHFALQTSQNRIYATSLLYQKLYRTENLSSVNMKVYLTELVQYLQEALGNTTSVAVTMNIEPIELDVSQGVPLGLMVNEIITNSFKYAFDKTIPYPEIDVAFSISQGIASLIIKDNGTGFPDADENNFGMGLKLVKGLAESIKGETSIVASNGTVVQVRFLPQGSLASGMHY
ncbi:histidine kinase dimerization/phosphoacceptor domain -containing protein [Niastella sp. OAS944]|uniref:tetratricopeptide repeat-containing sensor histidine kinase n=1 Tax=Niastella sp. OAS944 TaxID=2664089 RepID=UPI003494C9FC|nr:two-component sensor histidine kinase [Chitinophagaceae bacterium OAS944]